MEREIESLAGHPVRILARRLSIKERLNRLLERRLYSSERLKHVIVNSRSTRDELLRRYGLPADRVHVIYNGVDVDRYNPDRRASMRHIARRELDLAEDDYVILFLARNLRLKGLMQLLQTMAQLKPEPGRPGPRLLAVGNKHFAAYAGAAEALGIRRSVRFMGPMGEPDRLYAAADVLAHPTFHDPCANVCLEAMATGLPVVTTRANGACELIDDGQSGFVIDSATNVEALTERLGRLTDVDLRGSMGIAAREAVKNLTPGSNLALVMEVFKAVVEEKNRTS